MTYLGLDLGTSGLRGLLVDDAGAPIASASHGYPVRHPHPGWAEQDPADWLAALDAVMDDLRRATPRFADLRGIAVAGQMHGAVLLDARDQVVRPCILWNDTRSHAQAAQLDAAPGVRAAFGNIVFPGFTAPKLVWLHHNDPQSAARVRRVLLPAGYMNLHLTGAHVADVSDSAGTAWLDVGTRDWSPLLLQASGQRADQMPALVEGCAPAGALRAELAQRWGLTGPVTVAGGAADNAAAACGVGVMEQGDALVSLGTSGVVLAARDAFAPAAATAVHTFCHALPQRWYQMSVMLAATDCLTWLGQITGQSPADLTAPLAGRLHAPGPVQFFPYLSGERTPHNDAQVRAGFVGLDRATDVCDLTRAVLAGVAFGLRDGTEALLAAGATIDRLYAVGGGTASTYWMQLLATVLDRPLLCPDDAEAGAALGAARLAIIAATGAAPDTVVRAPTQSTVIAPDPQLTTRFAAAYEAFQAGFPPLKSLTAPRKDHPDPS